MPFYQRKGSKTYHSKPSCSRVPRNVKTNAGWAVRASKPKGKICIECAAKAKAKRTSPRAIDTVPLPERPLPWHRTRRTRRK